MVSIFYTIHKEMSKTIVNANMKKSRWYFKEQKFFLLVDLYRDVTSIFW